MEKTIVAMENEKQQLMLSLQKCMNLLKKLEV